MGVQQHTIIIYIKISSKATNTSTNSIIRNIDVRCSSIRGKPKPKKISNLLM